MTRRFQNVLRGYRGVAARDRYLRHLQGLADQGAGIGTKGGRPNSTELYITPFALPLGSNTYIKVSALDPSITLFAGNTEWTSRRKLAPQLVDGEVGIKLKNYKAPRIVRRTKDVSGTAATSKLTGLKYLKYNTNSASVPFGKGTADTGKGPFTVFTEIKGGFGVVSNVSFTFIDEDA